jgi:DNA topoisomerase-3
MRIIIAEKKNMAEDIARALGGSAQLQSGYFDCGSFRVTWCSGHLLEQVNPEDYDASLKRWDLEALPIIPNPFRMRPKSGTGPYAGMAQRQIEAIRVLVKSASEVIHAGDPGREGQLIVDEVLEWVGNKAPVKRLWLHAQTPEGIREGFARLKANTDYARLFYAARCRAEADWIVGMNCTRGWTLLWRQKGHDGVANVGRVKTPTLGLVVERDLQIENFVPVPYYGIEATLRHAKGTFTAAWVRPDDAAAPLYDSEGRLIDPKEARRIEREIDGKPGVISRADKSRQSTPPPLLPSLGTLQRLASKLGYSPEATLAAAQDLYDKHKLTTYPRTDCTYAPVSEWAKAKGILSMLADCMPDLMPWREVDAARQSQAWNDGKLGEHYAIIPTGKKPVLSSLPKREQDVFLLIVRLYAAQFFLDYEYLSTVIEARVGNHLLRATGTTPVQSGWKAALGQAFEDEKEAARVRKEQSQTLPDCAPKDAVQCLKAGVIDRKTTPPPPFTADTLLDAMENAHRFVHDPAVKARLKQVEGIGTPATRAGIIQSLVTGGFIEERKAARSLQYRSNERGRALISALPNVLKRVDFTAMLEGKLEDVAQGVMTPDAFRTDLKRFIERIVLRMKDGSALAEIGPASPAVRKPALKTTGSSRQTAAPRKTANRKVASHKKASAPRKSSAKASGQGWI